MEGSGAFNQVMSHVRAKETLLASSSNDPRDQFRQAKKLSELDAQITALLRSDASAARQVCAQAWTPRFALLNSLAFQRAEFETQGSLLVTATDNSSQKDTLEAAIQTPFEKLKRVTLREVHLCNRKESEFVLCRIISAASVRVGISFVAEDISGEAVFASVYNFTVGRTPAELDAVFKKGRIIAWKAPNLKLGASSALSVLLRCDNPRNLQFVDDLESSVLLGCHWYKKAPTPSSAAEWNAKGIRFARENAPEEAIKCLTRGIDEFVHNCSLDTKRDLFSNRARGHYSLGEYEKGLLDAEVAQEIDANHTESQIVKARCLYALGRFRESANALIRAKADQVECSRALVAVQQSECGTFKWEELVARVKQNPTVNLGCATFLSPSSIVKEITGKGRGVVSVKDIGRGTIVLVESALAVSNVTRSGSTNVLLAGTNRFMTPSQVSLCESLLSLASRDASVRQRILQLSTAVHQDIRDDHALGVVAKAVIATCSWEMKSCLEALGSNDNKSMSGLFFRGSQFNHSCMPNCCPSFLGDTMIVQTLVDIPAGEELTFSYVPIDASVGERKRLLSNRRFDCDCVRCKDEALFVDKLDALASTYHALHEQFSNGKAVHSLAVAIDALSDCKALKDAASGLFHSLKSMCAASAERAGKLPLAIKFWEEVIRHRSEESMIDRATALLTASECFKLAYLCKCA